MKRVKERRRVGRVKLLSGMKWTACSVARRNRRRRKRTRRLLRGRKQERGLKEKKALRQERERSR
eukprot:27376-Eustigmatos_ZCMA.PRE.1